MPRFSVALDDEENEWVERLADERDRSKSHIVASIVEAARDGDFDPFGGGEPDRTAMNRIDELEERVAELEARESARDALAEERFTADEEDAAPGVTSGDSVTGDDVTDEHRDGDDVTPGPSSESETDGEITTGASDEEIREALVKTIEDRPPHKTHAKRATVAAVLALREHGVMSTAEIQEAVHSTDDLAEHYTDARTLWNSISRYLPDVPGAKKGGYGEWEYAGDEAVLGE